MPDVAAVTAYSLYLIPAAGHPATGAGRRSAGKDGEMSHPATAPDMCWRRQLPMWMRSLPRCGPPTRLRQARHVTPLAAVGDEVSAAPAPCSAHTGGSRPRRSTASPLTLERHRLRDTPKRPRGLVSHALDTINAPIRRWVVEPQRSPAGPAGCYDRALAAESPITALTGGTTTRYPIRA